MVIAPSRAAVEGHVEPVADQRDAHGKAEHIAYRLHQPGDARRNKRQDDVEPHVLAAPQQPRRGEEGHEIERVFRDLVRPGKSGTHEIAQHDVGGDDHDHRKQDQRRHDGERVEQSAEGNGSAGHCGAHHHKLVIPAKAGIQFRTIGREAPWPHIHGRRLLDHRLRG